MALISLGSLAAAIFLGFFRKMNTGLVCIGFALLLGKLAGIPDKEIIGGFNYSLFLMLLGVTYLFGLAEWNGTLKLLTKKITVLAGKRTYLIPVVMYLFATVLSALGPGTIPTTAIMMVFGMTLAVEMKINPGSNHIPRCGRRRYVASCSDGDHRTQPVRRIRTDRYRSASAGERRIFIHRVCRCRLHRFRRV